MIDQIKARAEAVKNRETWARDVMRKYADKDIPYLLAEIDRLTERAEKAEKRAEAAIRDISEIAYFYKCMPCPMCKHDSRPVLVDGKIDETSPCRGCSRLNNHFEWRGEGEA